MKEETLLQHPKPVTLPAGNTALVPPIYTSVKFTMEKLEQLSDPDAFVYSRYTNPTVRELEFQLAVLQGCEDGIALGSGCAAISAPLLSLTKAGDHVILFAESYKPLRYLVCNMLAKFGVQFTLLSLSDSAGLEKAFQKNTRLIFFESPTNPMTHIADIAKITALAKKNGTITILDNTFAGPLNHKDCGIDLYVHSLTKFAAGHGDVMGGAVLGSKNQIRSLRADSSQIGANLDPFAASQISRGLKTYQVRRDRQCATSMELARWLESHPQVQKTWYPGLESHPQHALAKKQMRDFGAVIALDIRGQTVASFIERLELFTFAASLGSTESLAAPVEAFYAGDLTPEMQAKAGITAASVRLSVGLEALEDLKADLDQALKPR